MAYLIFIGIYASLVLVPDVRRVINCWLNFLCEEYEPDPNDIEWLYEPENQKWLEDVWSPPKPKQYKPLVPFPEELLKND